MACPLLDSPQNLLRRVSGRALEGVIMSNLLIVDDEPNVLNALRRMCQNNAILPAIPDPSITTFTSPMQAVKYVSEHRVDLVISITGCPTWTGRRS
jgi:CheY-like chemotaxis protein